MKKPLLAIALAVSLALNAAFFWSFVASRAHTAQPVAGTTSRESVRARIDAQFWPGLQTGDLPALIKRLETAGFPPAMVRAIIGELVRQEFAPQRRASAGSWGNTPYWKSPRRPQVNAALQRLYREQEKRLAGLFNDPPPTAQQGSLDFLPQERRTAVERLQAEFFSRQMDLWNEGATGRKTRALERQKHEALAQLLTPAELLEYDLRSSRTADQMRESLQAFDPTEAEFRAIYPLQAAFDERWDLNAFDVPPSAERMRERQEAERQLGDAIKAVLSPERAAFYERATDWDYIHTSQLVARLELPRVTTDRLIATEQEFEQRRAAIARAVQSAADRSAQFTALQNEATARVTTLLGNDPAVTQVYQTHGGEWLARLAPAPDAGDQKRGPGD